MCFPESTFAGNGIDTGATAWMLTSTAFVLLMVPGLAMFYGGLVRSKNVLGTMMHSFAAMGIMSVLWIIIGYSMCFGPSVLGGWFGWNKDYILLNGIDQSILRGFSCFCCCSDIRLNGPGEIRDNYPGLNSRCIC